jgi:hypothetical protein
VIAGTSSLITTACVAIALCWVARSIEAECPRHDLAEQLEVAIGFRVRSLVDYGLDADERVAVEHARCTM